MATLVLGDPPELQALRERRRLAGADRHDEVWEGCAAHDSRALWSAFVRPTAARGGVGPARACRGVRSWHRGGSISAARRITARLMADCSAAGSSVCGIARLRWFWRSSRRAMRWSKLAFYAAHQVDELLIVDPLDRTVDWLALEDGKYGRIERSRLIEFAPAELAARLDWPTVG